MYGNIKINTELYIGKDKEYYTNSHNCNNIPLPDKR